MSQLQVTFRSITETPAIHQQIEKNFKRINRIYPKLNHLALVLEIDHKHKHKGKMFNVRIEGTAPGTQFFTSKQNQNLYAAIRECFHALDKTLSKNIKRKPEHKSLNEYMHSRLSAQI